MFKDLETKRLFLKIMNMDDLEFIYTQFSDDFINTYLFDAEPVKTLKEAEEIILNYSVPEPRNQNRWIIIKKVIIVKLELVDFIVGI